MLADKGDFDRLGADARAVTICKAVGKGFVILDTQEHGDLEPDAHVPWQFWNYLDAAPTLVSRHNGTQGAGRGRREQFRFFAESGQYFLRIAATESWPWSLEKLRLQVNTTPVERPFEPNQQPRAATWLVSDVPIRTSLFPEDDVDWFRLAAAKPGPLVFELTDVPDDLDPMVEIYAADALDAPLKGFNATQGGGYGHAEMFRFDLPDAGEYLLKVFTYDYHGKHASPRPFGIRAKFVQDEQARPPRVASITPADGLRGVAPRPAVVVNFDRPLLPATLSAETLTIRDSDGNVLNGAIKFDPARYQAVFTPSEDLAPGESVAVAATANIRGIFGGQLPQPQSWTFDAFDTARGDPCTTTVQIRLERGPVAGVGETQVVVTPSVRLQAGPTLTARLQNGTQLPTAPLSPGEDGQWETKLTVPAGTPSGSATFQFTGVDQRNRPATEISQGAAFLVDTQPPPPMPAPTVRPAPGGSARLTWQRPAGVSDLAGYRLFRAAQTSAGLAEAQLVRSIVGADSRSWEDPAPEDATWAYTVAAVDRAGNRGKRSPPVSVTTDRVAPEKPVVGVAARTSGRHRVEITWHATDESGVDGYNVYCFKPSKPLPTLTAAAPLSRQRRPRTGLSDVRDRDDTYIYVVAARDEAGNLGPQSEPAEVVVDTRIAIATFALAQDPPLPQGRHTFTVTLDEPLAAGLELTLKMPDRSIRKAEVTRQGDLHYEAAATFTEDDPEGWVTFQPAGEDRYGNRGIAIRGSRSFQIDTGPPKAWIRGIGSRAGIGTRALSVDFSEDVPDGASMGYTVAGARREIVLRRENPRRFVGELALAADAANGPAVFDVSATDRFGHTGGQIVEGRDFTIDTVAPLPPIRPAVRPGPERSLAISWTSPTGEPIAFFRLYGGTKPDLKPSEATRLMDTIRRPQAEHQCQPDETLWFIVTAVDLAGNESPASKAVKGVADTEPPPPVGDVSVVLPADDRLRIDWKPPETDEPVGYQVYRSTEALTDVAQREPEHETSRAFVTDAPETPGTYYYHVTAVDEAGSRSPPAAAEAVEYDVVPPTATVRVEPATGTRRYSDEPFRWRPIGVLSAGEKTVRLEVDEPLPETPTLRYRTPSFDSPREIPLTETDGRWQGTITMPDATDDGLLTFFFRGTDAKGNEGHEIPKGRGDKFWVDTTPPKPVLSLETTARPRGAVELVWSPSVGEPDGSLTYTVYRADAADADVTELQPIASGIGENHATDTPDDDGTYYYAVVAVDAGGNVSEVGRWISALSDGTPPEAPTQLQARVKGRVLLTWQAEQDKALRFEVLRNNEPLTTDVIDRAHVDTPPADGTYAYQVVAVDAAGNRSVASDTVPVEFVDTLPAATIVTEPASPLRSAFRVIVTSSLPLREPPELFLHDAAGKAIRVATEKRDAAGTQYVGSVEVTDATRNGPARFTFLGTTPDGTRSTRIAAGESIVIDTRPPSATITLTPSSPVRPGPLQVVLAPSEPLAEKPSLRCTTPGRGIREIPLTPDQEKYTGRFEIAAEDLDGTGLFEFSGIDLAGNVGATLHGSKFVIDSHPPKPPASPTAVDWQVPVYRADEPQDEIVGYNVYMDARQFVGVEGMTPVQTRVVRLPVRVLPPHDGEFFFGVTTVDSTGLESPPSAVITCSSDRTRPLPPQDVKAAVSADAIEVSWQSDDAVVFSVFVQPPGSESPQEVARRITEKACRYVPLPGGVYRFHVVAFDALGHASEASEPARVEFRQHAPLATIELPGATLGRGTFPLRMQTTRPLTRPPKLRLVCEGGDPVDVALEGAGTTRTGEVTIGEAVIGAEARFEYEGVALHEDREITGRGILSGGTLRLDLKPPSAELTFADDLPRRDRRVVLRAGSYPLVVIASEPLKGAPVLSLHAKTTQDVPLTRESATHFSGVLTIDPVAGDPVAGDHTVGDHTGVFEIAMVDAYGNEGDQLGTVTNVEVDVTPPPQIAAVRAVALPRGKARVEWTPPLGANGTPDADANTFYVYRAESEITDVKGLSPHVIVEKTLGTIDEPQFDRDYCYAVVARDTAGNVGPVSPSAKVHVDRTPPLVPWDLRATQTTGGVVHLNWQPPSGEKPLFYNVYLAEHPILDVAGMRPRNRGVTWTEIYGTPPENGRYYFAVTAVDAALNEGLPSQGVMLDYTARAPIATFSIEPDIWLPTGEYHVALTTTAELVEPPEVQIRSENGARYPIPFEGSDARWSATVKIDERFEQGTYGFVFRGKDAQGNVGTEIAEGPMFYVDKTDPLPPDELKVENATEDAPGAVVLSWVTPKRAGQQTGVPYFYNVYRSTEPITSIESLRPIHTKRVVYEKLDNYRYTDPPPADGTYYYAVTSLDMARNESALSNVTKIEVRENVPRASIEVFALVDDRPVPLATDAEGRPLVGRGKMRVVVRTTSPLKAAPEVACYLEKQQSKQIGVAMRGQGTDWQGEFDVNLDPQRRETATFQFAGTSTDGICGTFIRRGRQFIIDTRGPVAEVVIPSIYRMKVDVKTNGLAVPPVRGGMVKVELSADEELAQPPLLTYTLDDAAPIPIPTSGFGRHRRGFVEIPDSPEPQAGRFQFRGVDRAGNASSEIAVRRFPFEQDDGLIARKTANYATTGGRFTSDTEAPETPTDVETETRRLGVAVIKWQEPSGDPASYHLYRSLAPIASTEALEPIKTGILATIIVDAPPVDGNYFYAVAAEDLAGNVGPLSECRSVFIDTIKPELKIEAVPAGEDFVILLDETAPEEISLTIDFPGQPTRRVKLGGSSGELQQFRVQRTPGGRRAVILPQMAQYFNGRVEVVVNSPDPAQNIVEQRTEIRAKRIDAATGGTFGSADGQVEFVIPPGLKPEIPEGPDTKPRVSGYEDLFFIQYANIPDEKPETPPGEPRHRDQVDPLPPGLAIVGRPYTIQMNVAPEKPLQLRGAATQADVSPLKPLATKLRMRIPARYSDSVESVDYLKSRLKVIKWVPAAAGDEDGHWQRVEDVEIDVENNQIVAPANDVTTYVVISEQTPPSIRQRRPAPGSAVTELRPEIGCLVVDKGTGVAVDAGNRPVITLDGVPIDGRFLKTERRAPAISKGDPTEVEISFQPSEDLAPGVHTVGVRAEDVVENKAIVHWQFTVDNRPPEFEDLSPAENDRLAVARPIVRAVISDEGGIASGRTELSIDERRVDAERVAYDETTGTLTYPCEFDLTGGVHRVTLRVVDKAGLSAERSWSFNVDLDPPAASHITPRQGTSVELGPTEAGLVLEDQFGSVRILDVRLGDKKIPAERGQEQGYRFDEASGRLRIPLTETAAAGTYRVSVLYADDLGNTGSTSWDFTAATQPATPSAGEGDPVGPTPQPNAAVVKVPPVRGLSVQAAKKAIVAAGLTPKFRLGIEAATEDRALHVYAVEPRAGTVLAPGSQVELSIYSP